MRSASVSVLDVLLHGRHVGTLHRTPNGARHAAPTLGRVAALAQGA
jgi:hypothetical protein